ncbi:MAG TPA: hypothetical protein VKZ75_00545 [Cyclobacteriaceae bacterium]|nr:hypothetical protein [Cyclobacteriaceae bacterium]
MTPTDSLERARRDSIDNVYRDSVAKAEEARLAYLNRPWKLGAFVDQFGDPTDEKYVRTEVEGVFKNSATSGSNLFVEVLLDKTSAGIFLHEYSRTRPAEKLIGGAQIQMKNSANQKIVINTSGEWNQSGGIRIDNYIGEYVQNYDFSKFKSFIQKSKGQIKVVIFDDYSSVYSFSIDATGFTKEFSQL